MITLPAAEQLEKRDNQPDGFIIALHKVLSSLAQ
jgi:hypothetical protein